MAIKQYNPKDKIWWVTGDSKDNLTKTEWTGNRTRFALMKTLYPPLRKTVISYLMYQRNDLEKPFIVTYDDLVDLGVIVRDAKNCSKHFLTKKKPLLK